LATEFPAAEVYAARFAKVRLTTTSKFARPRAIIATCPAVRQQLPAIFSFCGHDRFSSTPMSID
jgi:hypothetical protein